MTATNHALTGAIIGLVVGQPLIAIPLAVLSHFVLDAVPHFGTGTPDKVAYKTNAFRNYLIAEAAICFLLVCLLVVTQPANYMLAAICAFVAAAPDLLSINQYIKIRHGKVWKPGLYSRFAKRIQWFERPIGAAVELTWAICAIFLLAKLV